VTSSWSLFTQLWIYIHSKKEGKKEENEIKEIKKNDLMREIERHKKEKY